MLFKHNDRMTADFSPEDLKFKLERQIKNDRMRE